MQGVTTFKENIRLHFNLCTFGNKDTLLQWDTVPRKNCWVMRCSGGLYGGTKLGERGVQTT